MEASATCIQRVSGEFEAQQIKAFLGVHDIPCEFRGEALRKTHGLTLDGLGMVEIHVPLEHVERARELLARVESGEMRIEDLPATTETDGGSSEP